MADISIGRATRAESLRPPEETKESAKSKALEGRSATLDAGGASRIARQEAKGLDTPQPQGASSRSVQHDVEGKAPSRIAQTPHQGGGNIEFAGKGITSEHAERDFTKAGGTTAKEADYAVLTPHEGDKGGVHKGGEKTGGEGIYSVLRPPEGEGKAEGKSGANAVYEHLDGAARAPEGQGKFEGKAEANAVYRHLDGVARAPEGQSKAEGKSGANAVYGHLDGAARAPEGQSKAEGKADAKSIYGRLDSSTQHGAWGAAVSDYLSPRTDAPPLSSRQSKIADASPSRIQRLKGAIKDLMVAVKNLLSRSAQVSERPPNVFPRLVARDGSSWRNPALANRALPPLPTDGRQQAADANYEIPTRPRRR